MSMHSAGSSRQNHFANVPTSYHQRSAFNCDHTYKATFNSGLLIPFFWDEVSPGDTFKVKATAFIRFATLLFPLLDNVRFYTYYFFCPTRLLWDNARKFFGEQANPADSIAFNVPFMTATAGTGYTESTIFDYFGLPTKIPGYTHISLPLRMYNRVWNEWFRDQNIQNSVTMRTSDGSDVPGDFTLLSSCKIRDYFTSCLPFTQKGTALTIPLGTTAPIIRTPGGASGWVLYTAGTNSTLASQTGFSSDGSAVIRAAASNNAINVDPAGSLLADLTDATAATINSLRAAFQVQRFLERDARNGTRYSELVYSHFGVQFHDLSYRPLYLGGSSDPMNISVVAQTAPASGGSTKLASLAGFGTAVLHDHGFTHSFTEHGYVLGLIVARADITYQQGLNRKWSRSTRYDYPWPVFAHLGEQAVRNKEIYCEGTGGTDDANTFGYQEMYAENRYRPNILVGLFRSNATGSIDSWHLAQNFVSLPTLGDTFIKDNPPTTRVKATSTDPDFIMDMRISQTTVSCLPTYSVPGYIDHF